MPSTRQTASYLRTTNTRANSTNYLLRPFDALCGLAVQLVVKTQTPGRLALTVLMTENRHVCFSHVRHAQTSVTSSRHCSPLRWRGHGIAVPSGAVSVVRDTVGSVARPDIAADSPAPWRELTPHREARPRNPDARRAALAALRRERRRTLYSKENRLPGGVVMKLLHRVSTSR